MTISQWSSWRRSAALLGLGKMRGSDTVAVFMEEPMDLSSQPEESPCEAAGGDGMGKPAGCLGREGGFQVNCLIGCIVVLM